MKKLRRLLPLAALLGSIVALILFIALDAVVTKEGGGALVENGFQAMFGKTVMGMTVVKGSSGCLFALVLLIACIPLSAVSMKGNKVVQIIAAVLLLVSAIMLFSTTSFVLAANDAKEAADMYKNGAGPVVAGVFCIIGFIATALPAVLGFVKKED